MITIKSKREIELMRHSGKIASRTLDMIAGYIKPGVSTEKLDKLCHDFVLSHGGVSAPLGYGAIPGQRKAFPKSICTSVNEVVCHGIPNKKEILKDGDIINVDVTALIDGFHGDTSRTFLVGEVKEDVKKLVEFTERILHEAIQIVKPGIRIGDIGHLIQTAAEAEGYGVVKEFTGHGLGRIFHEAPQIPHFGIPGKGMKLRKGMTFTIEPMINLGGAELYLLPDGWTAKTSDGLPTAQFEHSLAVTTDGYDILTLSQEGE